MPSPRTDLLRVAVGALLLLTACAPSRSARSESNTRVSSRSAVTSSRSIAASSELRSTDCPRAELSPLAVERRCVRLGEEAISAIAELIQLEDLRRYDAERISAIAAHPEPEVRRRAIRAAARIGEPAAVGLLLQALGDPVPAVRADAAFGLGLLGDAVRETIIAAIAAVAEDENEHDEPRLEAVWALGRIGGDLARQRVVGILEHELDAGGASPVLHEALLAAWRFQHEESTRRALVRAARHEDPDVRRHAVYALVRGAYTDVAPLLIERLADAHPETRALAVRGLGAHLSAADAPRPGDNDVVVVRRAVRAAADDPHPHVRINAARAIARTGEGALNALVELLGDDDGNVRIATAESIGQLEDTAAASVLERIVRDGEAFVSLRGTALVALARLDPAAATRAAATLAASANPLERLYAARALHAIPGDESAALLNRLAADAETAVALTASPEAAGQGGRPSNAASRDRDFYLRVVRELVAPELAGQPRPRARIHTRHGPILIEFAAADAPLTVENFLRLAADGYFDGIRWHRVVPNFVLQGGDPRGDGLGGPGYAIRDELNRIRYDRATVGMALAGPDTGGSQFFITHSPQPHLDGGYTVFGRVVDGMDAADRVVQDDAIVRIEVVTGPL